MAFWEYRSGFLVPTTTWHVHWQQVGLPMAKTTCMPNFSLPALCHGPEDGPVVLGASPGPVWVSPDHLQPSQLAFSWPRPHACQISAFRPSPMAQKMDLWYLGPALALFGPALTTSNHHHRPSHGQDHLHAKFQPSSPSLWPRRWTCATWGQPWPCLGWP